jgi:hypothetical protein
MKNKKIVFCIALFIVAAELALGGYLLYLNAGGVKIAALGVTFSPGQAKYLGVDPKEVLNASLDDLKIKNYRLSAYWNVIEPAPGQFDFSDIDWQLDAVEARGGNVIMAVGMRLPRWPECHPPKWATVLDDQARQTRILTMLSTVVNRYKNRAVIKSWQVENEPFLTIFGECPKPDAAFYKKELALVRSLDSRPIVMTESGELSTWLRAAAYADQVGVSMYRIVWNKYLGTLYYPLTPAYYRYRADIVRAMGKKIFVSELQAEPWERGTPLPQTTIAYQKDFMNAKRVVHAISFAKAAGFSDIYLWGVEWWYYLQKHDDLELWNAVKEEVRENN